MGIWFIGVDEAIQNEISVRTEPWDSKSPFSAPLSCETTRIWGLCRNLDCGLRTPNEGYHVVTG